MFFLAVKPETLELCQAGEGGQDPSPPRQSPPRQSPPGILRGQRMRVRKAVCGCFFVGLRKGSGGEVQVKGCEDSRVPGCSTQRPWPYRMKNTPLGSDTHHYTSVLQPWSRRATGRAAFRFHRKISTLVGAQVTR